jgi:CDGSH-type Zn-finger protein
MPDFTITMKPNGPYLISVEDAARLTLTDHEGRPILLPEGRNVALCRCGGSQRKPFCDGQHSKIGFRGAIAAVASTEVPPADEATPS